MKEPQSRQAVATVGGATTKNSSKGFVNWVKNHKLGVGVGALTAATAVTLTILGVKYWGKKESVGNPNKGNEPIENEIITEKDKDNATVGSKLDILEKDADDRKKIIKEHNEKIINDVINEKNDIKTNSKSDEIHIAIAQGMGIKTKLDGEGEKQLIANIDKIKNLVLNKKDYFKNNFVSYSQFKKIGKEFKTVDFKCTRDWKEANEIFSFDIIYNMLNSMFSDSVKLDDFKLTFRGNSFIFQFNNDVSIGIDFTKDLAISYSTKEFRSRIFTFKMPEGN